MLRTLLNIHILYMHICTLKLFSMTIQIPSQHLKSNWHNLINICQQITKILLSLYGRYLVMDFYCDGTRQAMEVLCSSAAFGSS